MTRKCRFCSENVNVDDRGFAFCRPCQAWDASECFHCRTIKGFPVAAARVTAEQAAKSLIADPPSAIMKKSFLYCERCFHNAYFVGKLGAIATCRLCNTTWDRLKSAVHAEGVA